MRARRSLTSSSELSSTLIAWSRPRVAVVGEGAQPVTSSVGAGFRRFFGFLLTKAYLAGVACWAVLLLLVPMQWYVYMLTVAFGVALAVGASYYQHSRTRRREAASSLDAPPGSRRSRRIVEKRDAVDP